jgi:hypothetical protein
MALKSIKPTRHPKKEKVFGGNGVFYTFPKGESAQIHIRIDFSQVPPPTNYYYAEAIYLRIDKEQGMSILSFGRRSEIGDEFSDRIDVVMPTKSLLGPFWLSTRPVEPLVDQILEQSSLTIETRKICAPKTQAITLFGNTIFVAIGEGESTLDFYHLSPREVHLAKSQKANMQLEPTVRIIMSTVLTKQFFNTLRPHAEGEVTPRPVLERSKRVARSL